MRIKDLILPFVLIGLGLAFVAVTVGVFLTKGKSGFWISKKMLIGSLLLSLTSIVNNSCEEPEIKCYLSGPPQNIIVLDNVDYSNTININISTETRLTGTIYDRNREDFSFNITDTLTTDTLQEGIIYASDDHYNKGDEKIYIKLRSELPANEYELNIYNSHQSEQYYHNPVRSYRLVVKNEE